MKIRLIISYIVLGFIFAGSVAAQPLPEVLRLTLETNPDLLSKEAERFELDQKLKIEMAGYLPKVDATVAYGREKNNNSATNNGGSLSLMKREATLSLTQMLFDGFEVVSKVEAAEARVKASSKDVYVTLENLLLRAIEVYLEVMRHGKMVEYAKENLESHQQIYQQIQLRTESGIAKKADLDQATGRLALARNNLLEMQANLRDAESNFKRVTGFDPKMLSRPEVAANILPVTEESSIALALRNNPSLKKAQMDIESSRADKRAAMATYYPKMNLEVATTDKKNASGSETTSDSLSLMLQMSYNVFRGGADRAREHAASWGIEQAKENYNLVHRQIEQAVKLSWNAYTSAKTQLGYRKEHTEATQRTRDAYKDQFVIGQRTLLDLLDSENELYSSRTNYISSQYAELLGRYRVLHGISKLADHFSVAIPEATKYQSRSWLDGF